MLLIPGKCPGIFLQLFLEKNSVLLQVYFDKRESLVYKRGKCYNKMLIRRNNNDK